MSTPMTPDREQEIRTEVLAEVVGWLVKKAREHRAKGPQYAKQSDVIGRLADKVQRGAVRPNNLLMLPPQGGPEDVVDLRAEVVRLRARVAELEKQLAEYEPLNPQQCPKGLHADWLVDSEHTHACPWCRVAELEALKPAQFQDCQACGAGYEYGQPCSMCEFKKRLAAAVADGPDALPRDLSPEQAQVIERDRPETDTAHHCTVPLSRRLDCGHCPHEVCQDCQRCPHTCRCATGGTS